MWRIKNTSDIHFERERDKKEDISKALSSYELGILQTGVYILVATRTCPEYVIRDALTQVTYTQKYSCSYTNMPRVGDT